ncbi:MAG: hypothetical protein WCX23_03025 [Candidatus Paceibacterota bacterium]|jgi:heat-inducible transcriptional repressor|nr:hypothetical protein [Candidatus Paceibacterota bacterium]MDD4830752.1 hypothetical protein [Candidatus Paceibacterota bacterium]MDD4874850.1 hypothetical protein [Candidatus Paceibacterota bacterium]
MLSIRQEQILNLLIQEYIDSAEPVSSQFLDEKYQFGVCPATIRNEMQKLANEGYLSQPHTSAGRVPTDKGYRFFVDCLLKEKIYREKEDFLDVWKDFEEQIEDSFRLTRLMAKKIAQETSSLASAYFPEEEIAVKEGWSGIFREPEFESLGYAERFAKIADEVEEKIGDFGQEEMQILIGAENPLPQAGDFSLIISKFSFPDRKTGFVAILGPKRMPYEKNINLINSFKKFLENI